MADALDHRATDVDRGGTHDPGGLGPLQQGPGRFRPLDAGHPAGGRRRQLSYGGPDHRLESRDDREMQGALPGQAARGALGAPSGLGPADARAAVGRVDPDVEVQGPAVWCDRLADPHAGHASRHHAPHSHTVPGSAPIRSRTGSSATCRQRIRPSRRRPPTPVLREPISKLLS
jgi:hypothetical protein